MWRHLVLGFLVVVASMTTANTFGTEPASRARPADAASPGRVVRLVPKEGGWKLEELLDHIQRTTGISILYESSDCTFHWAKVEFTGVQVIEEDRLFDWLQAVVNRRKLMLVPVGPKLPDGRQQWFLMDMSDPKSKAVYIEERDIDNYSGRDDLYVVTTLTLSYTDDTTLVRNALAPLSTQTGGIGRIQDIPGSRALIVGDYAPVVAEMKRRVSAIEIQACVDGAVKSVVDCLNF